MTLRHFHVTENTPGYLPDSDDDSYFSAETDAIAYADELADELAESIAEGGGDPQQSGLGTGYVLTMDSTRQYDLGRVIAVDTCFEDCERPA